MARRSMALLLLLPLTGLAGSPAAHAAPAAPAAPAGTTQTVPAASPSSATDTVFAKEFTVTIVHLPAPGIPKADIRLVGAPDKLRVESRQGFASLTSIYDRRKPLYLTLFPTNRTYRESSRGSIESLVKGHLERYATLPDGNPCGWKPDATCTAAGEEEVNGRRCRRWEAKFKSGKSGTYWVDTELRLIVRAQDPAFSFETKGLTVAPVPADSFVAPSNYTRKT